MNADTAQPQSIAQLVLDQQANDATAILFEDQSISYKQYVAACGQFANLLLERAGDGPLHIGVLLDNVPDYLTVLGGAALVGAAVVGLNPTRRGAELERDIRHSDCQFLITEDRHLSELEGLDIGVEQLRQFNIDQAHWQETLTAQKDKPIPVLQINPADPYLLIFTSGTTGNPKAALCSQARLAGIAAVFPEMNGISDQDIAYLAMPLFHSNSLMANWSPMLAVGATIALRRKFSASGFLPDVRRYGCTYMNYVGKPLTYILATPEQADDTDNTMVLAFGNEAVVHDIQRFEKRFACAVRDNYGSTEGGINIMRTPETPKDALGIGQPGTVVLNQETQQPCAVAEFDQHGRLSNADQAVGEIANIQSAQLFEGYWRNEDANSERTQGGIFWSGDLGYIDKQGFLYFGGRNYDWLRVDGENFAAAPIENILTRHSGIGISAVYAVPNSDGGDDVMATLLLSPGAEFTSLDMQAFLSSQSDLGTKSVPKYFRVTQAMPTTASNKVVKRQLRAEAWECADPVWIRQKDGSYQLLDDAERQTIRALFESRGRAALLDF